MWLLKTTIEGCGEFIVITFILLKPAVDNPVPHKLWRNGQVIIYYYIFVFLRNAIRGLLSCNDIIDDKPARLILKYYISDV